jgi:hypothetical protein
MNSHRRWRRAVLLFGWLLLRRALAGDFLPSTSRRERVQVKIDGTGRTTAIPLDDDDDDYNAVAPLLLPPVPSSSWHSSSSSRSRTATSQYGRRNAVECTGTTTTTVGSGQNITRVVVVAVVAVVVVVVVHLTCPKNHPRRTASQPRRGKEKERGKEREQMTERGKEREQMTERGRDTMETRMKPWNSAGSIITGLSMYPRTGRVEKERGRGETNIHQLTVGDFMGSQKVHPLPKDHYLPRKDRRPPKGHPLQKDHPLPKDWHPLPKAKGIRVPREVKSHRAMVIVS